MTRQPPLSGEPTFGAASLDLLRRIVVQVAARHNYPPPHGYDSWRRSAVDEWLSDVFLPKKGTETVVKLQVAATNETSVFSQLTTTVHNVFRDESRATVVGRLMDRLESILGRDGGLVDGSAHTGGSRSWTLAELGPKTFSGDWSELLRAPAMRSLPALAPLNESGPTSSTNRKVLSSAARALVEVAGGAVRAADLAKALVKLYELDDPELDELHGSDEAGFSVTSQPPLAPGEQLVRSDAAQAIFDQLDSDEVMLLPHLDKSVAVVRRLVPDVAAPARRLPELRSKLHGLLQHQGEPDAVMGEVLRLIDESIGADHGD